jgi:hypothetical protein
MALIIWQPSQVYTFTCKRALRVWRMALLIKRPIHVHTFTYMKDLAVWTMALLIKRPVNVHTFTYTKDLAVWRMELLIKRPVNVHTFTYTRALTSDGWRYSLKYLYMYILSHTRKKVPLQNLIHGCNRDTTRHTHTKKLPVVVPPVFLTSNTNCQTDQAILLPTFYLNSVSIYGLRNTLVLVNHAASEDKCTYYSNDTGAFQGLFVLTVWAFRAFRTSRAAQANANPAWPAADRYK